MTEKTDVVQLLDACRLARHAWSLLPQLPKGLTGGHIRVLGVIQSREAQGLAPTHASTIADALEVSRPGITRLLNELEAWAFIQRDPDPADGRRSTVTLTPAGTEAAMEFVVDYHAQLAELLEGVSPEDISATISTINCLHHAITHLAKERSAS